MMFHWYGLIIGVGIVVAVTVAERVSKGRLPIQESVWFMLVPGIVGARLYHVIDLWEYYSVHLEEIVKIWQGGLGIWGGIVGGVIGLGIFSYLRAKKIETKIREEFFVLADVYALVTPLAQSIGRIGNLVNNELVGTGELPLFVYEGGLNLVLFVILLLVYRRKVRGSTFGGYLVGYGVIRIILEPLRGVEVFRIGGYPVAQIAGVTAIVVGIMILGRKDKKIWSQ